MGLIQPVPSFAQGYATHGASRVPGAWKGVIAAYAPFLGVQGNKLYDFGGLGNHGLINGATWVPGRDGSALDFDGGTDVVNMGNRGIFENNDFTISARIKREAIGAGMFIVGIQDQSSLAGGYSGVSLSFNSNNTIKVNVMINNLIESFITISTFTDTDWHQVVATKSGTAIKIYVDNVDEPLDDNTASSSIVDYTTSQSKRTNIGAAWVDDGITPRYVAFFNGLIDSVFICNRALCPAEIAWHYSNPYAMFQRQISPAMFFVPVVPGILDLFNPQLKSLKQEHQMQAEKQEYQIKSLKQEGQIKWLQ